MHPATGGPGCWPGRAGVRWQDDSITQRVAAGRNRHVSRGTGTLRRMQVCPAREVRSLVLPLSRPLDLRATLAVKGLIGPSLRVRPRLVPPHTRGVAPF